MLVIVFVLIIFLILVYVMDESLVINIQDLSWNRLAMMQEQTRQLEIIEANKTARWMLVAESIKYLGLVVIFYFVYRFGQSICNYLMKNALREEDKYKQLPAPNRMIYNRYGADSYNRLIDYTETNGFDIVLYDGKPAIKKSDTYHIIEL